MLPPMDMGKTNSFTLNTRHIMTLLILLGPRNLSSGIGRSLQTMGKIVGSRLFLSDSKANGTATIPISYSFLLLVFLDLHLTFTLFTLLFIFSLRWLTCVAVSGYR